MLPKKEGVAVLKSIRSVGIKTPVLFLTAKDTIEDKVEGLDAGADFNNVEIYIYLTFRILNSVVQLFSQPKGIEWAVHAKLIQLIVKKTI